MIINHRTASAKEIHLLYAQLPELNAHHSLMDIEMRLQHRPHLMLVAEVNGRPVGFIAGYALNTAEFHLWLGGVLPGFRRRGVARALLAAQETWAKSRGYHTINVKSGSRFQGMLLFLISNHYQQTRIEAQDNEEENKIWLEKNYGNQLIVFSGSSDCKQRNG
ncbi:GNAT family N-acetyltransferase [Acerihabitans arboris]|uniref:GNAT family N-acetyltransferase n=1 Tax=Acerihabitans arboris TaxID=2691583 RepID=A0A845SMX7_9GAMM|nr:GNAT family N-acetyltransferase [Acerihabitans arboris]NDL64567.1 GNAT family N-acetyltransferase [Acerihabitans arboris]